MLKKLFLRILICVFLITSQNAFSQFLSLEEISDEIFLIAGEIKVLEVYSPKRVSVRNPEIADVDSVSNKELILVAKQAGSTTLTICDGEGERLFYITVYSQDPDALKRRLERLIHERLKIKEVYLRKNDLTGKVMVIGEVTAVEKAQIETILEPFIESTDNLLVVKEEVRMVEIECYILELTKSFSKVFGLDWTGTSGSSPAKLAQLTSAASTGKFKEVFRIVDFTRAALDVQLMAAVNEGKGKILAKPKLLCLSGEEASFLVGGEIPVVTITTTSSADVVAENVEYKEYGVKLNIQPVVLKNGDIRVNLVTEVKEISSEGQYVRANGTTILAFTTRNVSTVLNLQPGQGVVISGLFKDKVTKDDISKIPGLGDIPILGALFRSKDYQDNQTELVISLIPRLINVEEKEKKIIAVKDDEPFFSRLKVYPRYLEEEAALNHYILEIQKIIFQSLDYPRLAQEAGWQGMVKVKLHLDSEGELIDVQISESSGYLFFDNNVLKITKSLSPYPPFPSDIRLKDLWIDIPIVYEMD